jgi:dihydroorotate dehydrogenase
MLAETYVRVESAFPLIGVGGIHSGETALAKIRAGATLIQLYTGLVYGGLSLANEIKRHLADAIRSDQAGSIAELIGRDAQRLTAEPWPAG